MKNKYKAFTLAESLIVLCTIGVIAALVLPALLGALPDRKKAMFKKAYSIIESTVGELVNDENYYPYDESAIGFKNGVSVNFEGTTDSTSNNAGEKFCELFASKLNLIGEKTISSSTCTMDTSDGIRYSFSTDDDFDEGSNSNAKKITIDINGDDTPNSDSDDVSGRDIYYVYVVFDGRVYVEENSTESKYLRSTKINTSQGTTTR